jgi:hypothetical protein
VRDAEDVAVDQVELDALNQAVQDFYLRVAEQGGIQAMASFDLAPGDCPEDIWLFAIASRHNTMSTDEHAIFALDFIDTPIPFSPGNARSATSGYGCAEAMEIGKQVYRT